MAFLVPVIASASASTLIGTGLAVASAASIKQGQDEKRVTRLVQNIKS